MGTTALNDEVEVCPECGNFVDVLNDITGWCHECSGTTPVASVTILYLWSGRRTVNNSWLTRNADSLDRLLAEGTSFLAAVEGVLSENRPVCQSCGDVIKRVAAQTRGKVLFCRKREQCHKASVRYKYYRVQKHLPSHEALEKALRGIQRV